MFIVYNIICDFQELSDAEKDANNSIPLCIFEQENDTIIKSTSGCAKKRKCTVPNNTQKEREQDTRKQVTHVMNKPSDDYSIFGEFVASELRQLHSEEKRRKLKRIIQMAIIEVGQEEEWEICPPQSTPSSTPLLHFSPDEGGN